MPAVAPAATSVAPAPVTAAPTTTDARLVGVDAARGLAVVGMLAAHLGPSWAQPGAPWIWDLAQGPPSLLFVLVTGIVMSRTNRPAAALARRAGVLLLLGLVLATLQPPVWVILQVTACVLVAGAGLRHLQTRTLLLLAAALVLAGPVAVAAGRDLEPGTPGALELSDLADPLQGLWSLAITGAYPVLVWLLPLTIGIALGRLDLQNPRVLRRMLAGALLGLLIVRALVRLAAPHTVGDATAAAALNAQLGGVPHPTVAWLLGGWPHAGTTLELASGLLAATAVLALLCLLVPTGRGLPLAIIGRLALTVYVAQVLLLTAWPGLTGHPAGDAVFLVALLTAAAAIAGHLVLRRWRRGPLEALLHTATVRRPRSSGNRA